MAGNPGRRNPSPPLVAIEGIDGSGKTTLAAVLAADLAWRGIQVTGHREPRGGACWQVAALADQDKDRHPMMLALLSAADRYGPEEELPPGTTSAE